MATRAKKFNKSIVPKIKEKLDGRPQRWLALKIEMSETEMSNKMQGITKFSEDDLKKIGEVFECEFA